jgi:hypothetical protein
MHNTLIVILTLLMSTLIALLIIFLYHSKHLIFKYLENVYTKLP